MWARGQAAEKKSAVLDLSKHVDQRVRVKFTGGREGEPLRAPCLRVVSLHRRSRVRPVRSHALECVEEARWGRKCGDAAW